MKRLFSNISNAGIKNWPGGRKNAVVMQESKPTWNKTVTAFKKPYMPEPAAVSKEEEAQKEGENE